MRKKRETNRPRARASLGFLSFLFFTFSLFSFSSGERQNFFSSCFSPPFSSTPPPISLPSFSAMDNATAQAWRARVEELEVRYR